MATKIGLGVAMPLLAPATATWAAPFAVYYALLQNRIVWQRLKSSTWVSPVSCYRFAYKHKREMGLDWWWIGLFAHD